jgi:4-hydroxymandelate oxidase
MERLERLALDALPERAFAFLSTGAGELTTLRDNVEGWGRVRLLPRALVDVSDPNCRTTFLGAEVDAPIGIAPMGYQKVAHAEGEVATAKAASESGVLMTVSTRTSMPIPAVAEAMKGRPWWFQVYVLKDRSITEKLVDRAVEAGCGALILTADTPLVATKPRLAETSAGEFDLHLAELEGTAAEGSGRRDYEGLEQDPALDWSAIAWLKDLSGLPVVVKGILRPDDARRCVDRGADGIFVSNHGGRQLDSAAATADALGAVVKAVDEAVEVYVDGGIRSGIDVLKGLALGARGVFVGRPVLWGLAHDGARGVEEVVHALQTEFLEAMALAGAPRPSDVTRDLVARV